MILRRPEPPVEPKPPLEQAAERLDYALETLHRLPLAEAFYDLWSFLAPEAILSALFEAHRGRCYDDALRFHDLVGVIACALTRYRGSGRPAIGSAIEHRGLPCRQRAVYAKLGRVPLPLSEALLGTLTARLRPLFPAGMHRTSLPASLAGLSVVVIDGKKIKKAAKRLVDLRGRPGKLFGGKLLVAYLPAEGVAVAMAADPDGEANDVRLVPRLLPLARGAVAGPRLWVADRQFCNLDQPAQFAGGPGDHYLVRHSKATGFHPDGGRPAAGGVDGQGRAFTQEWGWLGAAGQGHRRAYVRRVTLHRPGEEDVAVVTDLLDEAAYPAEDLLATYLARWQIENVFQQITEVFDLRHLIGSAPRATVFQAALCLVIYNVLQLIRGHIAAGRPAPARVDDLSSEMIFRDLRDELVSLHKTLSPGELLGVLRQGHRRSAEELLESLRRRLAGVWSPLWLKVRNKKPRPHKPKAKQSGAHTSVHKALEQAKAARRKKEAQAARHNKDKKPLPCQQ